MAKNTGRPYKSCPHVGTLFAEAGKLHVRRLTRAGRIVCSACDAKTAATAAPCVHVWRASDRRCDRCGLQA